MSAIRWRSHPCAGLAEYAALKLIKLGGLASRSPLRQAASGPRGVLLALACGLGLLSGAAAVEGSAGPGSQGGAAQGRAIHPVSIVDFAFVPAAITANAGDTVSWTNNSAANSHTVTFDTLPVSSGPLAPGGSYSIALPAGTYTYHSTGDPATMTGSVTVAAAAAPAITSALSASGTVGAAFSYTITASGAAPITFSATNLPPGLLLNSPVISGTPTAAGTYAVALKAVSSAGVDTKTLTVIIVPATVATPVFTPPPGTYIGGTTVTVSCATPGVTMFFTVDGSAPTVYSNVYTMPIMITTTLTLEVYSTSPGMISSPIVVGTYAVTPPSGGGGGGGGSGGQVGGYGPDPVPVFVQNVGGGTPPVIVTFDPSQTYLPVSDNPNQVYEYEAIWNFGDGVSGAVGQGGTTAAGVLAQASHQYTAAAPIGTTYTVTFQINVIIFNLTLAPSDPDYAVKGPSAFTTGQVLIATANFPPAPHLEVLSSPATGDLPYYLQVTASTSFDVDGFIAWAGMDWGDGSFENIPANQLPPNIPNVIMSHPYVAPGIYRVVLSVIDNGRMAKTDLPAAPDASNPDAALQTYVKASNLAAIATPSLLNTSTNPQLKKDFVLVQVPGNMVVTKGQFGVSFTRSGADTLDILLRPNLFPDSIANASVQFLLGAGSAPLTFPPFFTDNRGRFQDSAQGFLFSFDVRKRQLHVTLSHSTLSAALLPANWINSTEVNAAVDVPLRIVINKSLTLGATVRFTYNAKANGKGTGRNGHSYPDGN
ncbi:MAG: chitobiase/beta-hexosaminidase C-terminal domain-containing protein [Planctomycetota bacterium]